MRKERVDMKKNMMTLIMIGCCMQLSGMQEKIAALKHVIVDVQKSGAGGKVVNDGKQIIADFKDIYSTLVPLIQQIKKDFAGNGALSSTAATTTSTTANNTTTTPAAVATTTSTATATATTQAPVTIVVGQPSVPQAVAQNNGTDTDAKGDKGKEKDSSTGIDSLIAHTATMSNQVSDDDLWVLVQDLNPNVYQFGQDYHVSAHDLLAFIHLLNQYHVTPEAVVDFMKAHHNQQDTTQAHNYTVDQCTKIQNQNPDKYQILVLAIIHQLFNQQDDKQPTPSVLNSTYTDILHGKVADQQSGIKWRNGGIATTVFGWIGTMIWAAYTQSHMVSGAVNGTLT